MNFLHYMLLGLLLSFCGTANAQQPTLPKENINSVHWGYKGNIAPERWAQLDPSFAICAKGTNQSPIDIPGKVIPAQKNLVINYQPTVFSVLNIGWTIQVNVPSDSNERITFNGQDFRLIELHVHAPSEHLWQGRDYLMEMHLVHRNQKGQLLFIAVFAEGGEENSVLAKILNNLPVNQNKEQPIDQKIDPNNILPHDRGYYSFMGSLTTPPCLEGVQWIVFAKPITVSPAQIVRFKQAFGGVNARPVQPLNNRKIYFSTQRKINYNRYPL